MDAKLGGENNFDYIKLNLNEVVHALDGKVLSCGKSIDSDENLVFSGVATDSRNVKKDFIFFPLVGTQDGHNYIDQAVGNGASVIFVTEFFANFHGEKIKSLVSEKLTIIAVSHTMYALQNLAALYVSKFPNLIKIGITGSSGKTTTKEIAVNVLSQKFKVVYNEGNLNSETGLPLSVFNIRSEHEIGIFEMGMNRKGEISELATVLKPKYAIITNIGTAHIGILGSRNNIATEKREIFKFFDSNCTGYVPEDDDFVDFLLQSKGNIKKYGFSMIDNVENLGIKGSSFTLDGEKITFPLCGKYNLKNALSVICLARDLGFTPRQIKSGLETVKPLFGRSQILEGKYTIIQDCYNANPDSMEKAIEFASSLQLKNGQKLFIVLGDMLELGEKSKEEHVSAAKKALEAEPSMICFVGTESVAGYETVIESGFDKTALSCGKDDDSVRQLSEDLVNFLEEGDVLLFKASRGIALERILDCITKEKIDG